MDESALQPAPLARTGLALTAPSRAFQTEGLARAWWAPYLVILVSSLLFVLAVATHVGWETAARTAMADSARSQKQMQSLTPEQRDAQVNTVARITEYSVSIGSVVGPLLFAALAAAVLLATLNFGFAGHARFGELFTVYLLSAMPQAIKGLLAAIVIFLIGGDSFRLNEPLGSNPAYYLHNAGLPAPLLSVLGWLDVFLIWQIALLIVGCAIVARLSRGRAAAAVLLWVVVLMAVGAGLASLR